uniref:F-box only protein 7-like n=1 Tax=Oncorhynchus gorbuscha TaxID=8017 RepID=UPI001EAF3C10|nr:F-box only protein 7-like [Oncorhynchus gorbuscha]
MALPAVFGLPVLPPELLLRVLRLLDVSSLLALSSVNRHLHQTTTDPALWRHLYRRDFRDSQDHSRDTQWREVSQVPVFYILTVADSQDHSRDTQWRELYKKKYKWRREAASYRHHMPRYHPVPHRSTPSTLPNNPFPFYPPGIIGGEYDQRPGIPGGILPRPRYDPIGPLPGHDPTAGGLIGRRGLRPAGNRPADIRRGFI